LLLLGTGIAGVFGLRSSRGESAHVGERQPWNGSARRH